MTVVVDWHYINTTELKYIKTWAAITALHPSSSLCIVTETLKSVWEAAVAALMKADSEMKPL